MLHPTGLNVIRPQSLSLSKIQSNPASSICLYCSNTFTTITTTRKCEQFISLKFNNGPVDLYVGPIIILSPIEVVLLGRFSINQRRSK